ncbi:MAG: hypothetical protein IH959_04210 [Chloroflexi bacterium]|nr:hypothetical protein [Chloroflexota bacterium]
MHRTFVLIIGSVLAAAACGDAGSEPQVTTTTAPEKPSPAVMVTPRPTQDAPKEERDGPLARPPELVVMWGDAAVTAGIGSYCWSGNGGVAICVDVVGVITPQVALVSDFYAPLVAQLPDVEQVSATVWRIDDRVLCEQGTLICGALPVEGGFAWPISRLGDGRELPTTVEGHLLQIPTSQLTPGTYVIAVSVNFQRMGDAMYGVLLTLLPSEG